jgi:hypothetical protein
MFRFFFANRDNEMGLGDKSKDRTKEKAGD